MRKQTLLVLTGVAAALTVGTTAQAGSPHRGCHTWRHGGTAYSGHVSFSHHAIARHTGVVVRAGGGRHWMGRASAPRWSHYAGRGAAWREEQGGEWASGAYRSEQRSFHEDHGWAMADGGVWADRGYERHMTVDRFGYLNWPGKAHFMRDEGGPPPTAGAPVEGPNLGPPPPPGEGPPPPPPGEGYEIRRF